MMLCEFKTNDGYVFYLLEDGSVVDSLNPDHVDMSWPSIESFIQDLRRY